jgi:hypothetical protein
MDGVVGGFVACQGGYKPDVVALPYSDGEAYKDARRLEAWGSGKFSCKGMAAACWIAGWLPMELPSTKFGCPELRSGCIIDDWWWY